MALSEVYAASHDKQERQQRSIAATFAPDPKMSLLETLKRDDPAAFAGTSVNTTLEVPHCARTGLHADERRGPHSSLGVMANAEETR